MRIMCHPMHKGPTRGRAPELAKLVVGQQKVPRVHESQKSSVTILKPPVVFPGKALSFPQREPINQPNWSPHYTICRCPPPSLPSEPPARPSSRTGPLLASPSVSSIGRWKLSSPLLGRLSGLPDGTVAVVGESTLADLRTRPDYAVTVTNALVGFIEVKAPCKGTMPLSFSDEHDKKHCTKLRILPNLIYTNGQSFSLWRDREQIGKLVPLEGEVESAGAALAAPDTLLPLINDFLHWSPTRRPAACASSLRPRQASAASFTTRLLMNLRAAMRASPRSRRSGADCCSRVRAMNSSPMATLGP